jgi:hypothetical protein
VNSVPPFRAIVRYVGYKGWWWHIEDAEGHLLNFIGSRITDIKEPDGVALRGRTVTQRGAKAKANRRLQEVKRHIPPEDGWVPQEFSSGDGRHWLRPSKPRHAGPD